MIAQQCFSAGIRCSTIIIESLTFIGLLGLSLGVNRTVLWSDFVTAGRMTGEQYQLAMLVNILYNVAELRVGPVTVCLSG